MHLLMSPLQRVARLDWAGDCMGEVGFHSPARDVHCPHMHQRPPAQHLYAPSLHSLSPYLLIQCREDLGFRLGEGGFLFFVTGCSRQIMPRAFWPPRVYLKRKQY